MRLSATADNEIIKNITEQLNLTNSQKSRIQLVSKRPYVAEEVVKKAKDTLVGLLASFYQNDEKLLPYHQAIFVDKKPIILLLFLERTDELNQDVHFKPLASNLKLAIEQKTNFICANINVINSLSLPEILEIKVSKM